MPSAPDLGTWPPRDAEPVPMPAADLYAGLAQSGLVYGPVYRGVEAMWRRGQEVFAEVALPGEPRPGPGTHAVHPALLDAALHPIALGGLIDGSESGLVPYAWSGVRVHAAAGGRVRVRLAPAGPHAVAVDVADPQGRPVVSIGSVVLRPMPAGASGGDDAGDGLLVPAWAQLPVLAEPVDTSRWALLTACEGGLDDLLLGECGTSRTYRDRTALVEALSSGETAPELLVLPCEGGDRGARASSVRETVDDVVQLAQLLTSDERLADTKLAVLTRGAVVVGGTQTIEELGHRAVWGLLRTVQTEHPDRFMLVDEDGTDESRRTLAAVLAAGESQAALRGGIPYRPTLTAEGQGTTLAPPADAAQWRLDYVAKESFTNLSLEPWPQAGAPLEHGQVRVRMRAAGLNFRDVLLSLGMVHASVDASAEDPGQGGEGAGVVLDVGPGVTDIVPGDRVMGLFSGVGPVSVTDRNLVCRMPDGWSFAQAAAVPVAYLTAYHGLVDLAALRPGESVLVHAGTGGVGTAALQLAHHLGATAYATASPAKWAALKAQGLPEDRIASSRTLDFEQVFRHNTEGRGVDVVLNSLAGEYVDASLRLLSGSGRFLEIGKTDRRDPDEVARDHPGTEYQSYDVRDPGPEHIQRMLVALLELFEQGALAPPPVSVWDVREAPAAFRYLSEARHVGKIVLDLPADETPWDTTRAVLVTGGFGWLGRLVAKHLATENGVRQLVLMGRRVPGADEPAGHAVAELRALGAEVHTVACDAADQEALAAALEGLASSGVRLGGVVHAAGVLDDGVFKTLTPQQLDRTLRPKVDAALNLHDLTEGLGLATFVVFSSVAGTFGSAGQSGYAAGNAFLDGLVEYRRSMGQPGLSVVWGPWEGGDGMTASLTSADTARMTRTGMAPLSAERGLELLDAAIRRNSPVAVAARWEFDGVTAPEAISPVLRDLLPTTPGSGAEPAPETTSGESLLDKVLHEVAVVLGHSSAGAVDPHEAFDQIGFDSLTVVELRNRLAKEIGIKLPVTFIYDWPTPTELVAHLREQMDDRTAGSAADAMPAEPAEDAS
ncbi:SDR family NAD(P)-dependent oxidoreductase [Saccharopolyspora erythraea]